VGPGTFAGEETSIRFYSPRDNLMFFSSLSRPLVYRRSVGWYDFDGLPLIPPQRHQTEGRNRMPDRTTSIFHRSR
jgi:hypothetical protein